MLYVAVISRCSSELVAHFDSDESVEHFFSISRIFNIHSRKIFNTRFPNFIDVLIADLVTRFVIILTVMVTSGICIYCKESKLRAQGAKWGPGTSPDTAVWGRSPPKAECISLSACMLNAKIVQTYTRLCAPCIMD